MTAAFEIEGQRFIVLTAARSANQLQPYRYVDCKTQKEVDHLWPKLSDGGQTMQRSWLTDKFGITGENIPSVLMKFLNDKDPQKSQRVMHAMMQTVKIDIQRIKRAYVDKS